MEFTNEITDEQRRDEVEQAKEREKERRKRVAWRLIPMGNCMMVMFWLLIPGVISGFLTNETFAEYVPAVYVCGEIISYACTVVYSVALFRMVSLDKRYLVAGSLFLVAAVITIVTTYVTGDEWVYSGVGLCVMAIGLCLECLGCVVEYTTHADLLSMLDVSFVKRWQALRLAQIIVHIVLGVGFIGGSATESLLLLMFGGLGSFAGGVVDILCYVTLYQGGSMLKAYESN